MASYNLREKIKDRQQIRNMKFAPTGTERSTTWEDKAIPLRHGVPVSEGESGIWCGPEGTGVNWGMWKGKGLILGKENSMGDAGQGCLRKSPALNQLPGPGDS